MVIQSDTFRVAALELSPGAGVPAYGQAVLCGGVSRGASCPAGRGSGAAAFDMGAAQKEAWRGGRRMNVLKTAAVGALGFAVGAGAMLMPGNQKLKRQAQKQIDKLVRMSKQW